MGDRCYFLYSINLIITFFFCSVRPFLLLEAVKNFQHCVNISNWIYNLQVVQIIKGLLKISSPNPSKQGQLWDQLRLLKALSNWILKTCKDGGCTMPLGNLFHCWLSLLTNVFLHIKPKPPSLPCIIASGPWLHFFDNLLVCITSLLLDHTNVFSQLKHCPAAGLLCSQDTELASVPPGEWQCQDHPSVIADMVYFFQFEQFYSLNSGSRDLEYWWRTSSFCSVLKFAALKGLYLEPKSCSLV